LHKDSLNLRTKEHFKKAGAFTLAEILVSLCISSILVAASIPLITQFSMLKTGKDKTVARCVIGHAVTAPTWYDTATGDTKPLTDATFTADPNCLDTVKAIQFDSGKSYDTAAYYANFGTPAQVTMGKELLRAACDQGGTKACDYFINT
jgi:type II secretory pathway pseudopilin PulG